MIVKKFINDLKMITRFTLGVLLIISMLVPNLLVGVSRAETIADGNYKIPISLVSKYEEKKSMGNPAMTQYGILSVKNGKATMKIKFVALEFIGYRGFLGEFYVRGQKVQELNHYDDIDVYNDPSKGKDKRMKGKNYPKELKFDVNIGEKDIPVSVYVPVMEEVSGGSGGGQKDAKLRIEWPSDYNSVRVNSDSFDNIGEQVSEPPKQEDNADGIYSPQDKRNLPPLEKGEDLKLEDGLYSMTVNLQHEREDKLSMGNGSMIHTANIIAENGKYKMLIGSEKMQVQGIIASLVSLQIRDDNAYYRFAEPHAFDLVIPNEEDKRPKVFSFDIKRKDPMIYVKVDPKVKPMGEVPIGARFKFDWSSLKKIDEKDALLYNLMKTGTPRKKFNPNETIVKNTEKFQLVARPGSFKDNIRFKVDTITGGNDYTKVMKRFGRSSNFVMYNFKVENDYGIPQKPDKNINIKFKLPENIKNPKSYYVSDMSEISSKSNNGQIDLTLGKLGQVAIVSTESARDKKASPKKGNIISSNKRKSRNNSNYKSSNKSNSIRTSSDKKDKSNSKLKDKADSDLGLRDKSSSSELSGTLKNDSNDFATTNDNEARQDKNIVKEKDEIKAKENPKVIFYSLLILISILIASAYAYIKVGKKLLYEIKLGRKLDGEISRSRDKKSIIINSWLDKI